MKILKRFTILFISIASVIVAFENCAGTNSAPGNLGNNGAAAAATVTATGITGSHSIGANYLGLNIENFYVGGSPAWTDPTSQSAIQSLNISQLRFPGGADANYWDWQVGWYWTGYSPAPTSVSSVQDTLANFLPLATSTNTSPLYVLNVMTYQTKVISPSTMSAAIANQVAMLQAASQQGLPVEYLELGNEFYFSPTDYVNAFADGNAYASSMNTWITSLRKDYPNAQMAVVGALYKPETARMSSWNQDVLENIKGANAVTLHRYDILSTSGLTPDVILADAISNWSQDESMFVQPVASSGLPIWLTEFDIDDQTVKYPATNYSYYSTWLQGLYVGTMVLQFLDESAISQISYYNLDSDRRHSIYFDSVYTINGQSTVKGALTASGQALGLVGRALKGATSTSSLTLSGVPQVSSSQGASYAPYPALMGIEAKDANSASQIVLINLSASAITVNLSQVSNGANLETLTAASPTTLVISNQSVSLSTTSMTSSSVTLPPYSINRFY